jgi:RimJ/RimL family protein N-acetyltransferase
MSESMVPHNIRVATLKNGVRVVLRQFVAEDRDALMAFFQRLPAEEIATMRDDVTNPHVVDSWIKSMDPRRIYSIVAETGEKIIGDATLMMKTGGWHRHVGEIRLAVEESFRMQGLGLLMSSELVSVALQFNLDKLVAEVMREQIKVISMLERLGFHKEAELRDHIMDLGGRKHDLVILTHFVGALWENLYDSEFYQVRLNQMED